MDKSGRQGDGSRQESNHKLALAEDKFRAGAWAEAENHIRAAIAIDPKNHRAHNDLGVLLHSQNKTESALKSIHLALSLNAEYTDAALNCAEILLTQGRHEERNSFLRNYLGKNPKDEEVRDTLMASEELEMRSQNS